VAEPSRRLAPAARIVWGLEALGWALPLVIAGVVGGAALGSTEVPDWVAPALRWTSIAVAVVGVLVVPQLRWRRWRYEVREREIDLRRGMFSVVRTVVPMSRIQHVETRRTALSQPFDLTTVVVHTAAGATEIPALDGAEAGELRDRIAHLAQAPDDV
jgi:uncharacterized protein